MKKIIKLLMDLVLFQASREEINGKLSFTDKLTITNATKQILQILKIK